MTARVAGRWEGDTEVLDKGQTRGDRDMVQTGDLPLEKSSRGVLFFRLKTLMCCSLIKVKYNSVPQKKVRISTVKFKIFANIVF